MENKKTMPKGNPILGFIIIGVIIFFGIKACSPSIPDGTQDLKAALEVFENGKISIGDTFVRVEFEVSSNLTSESMVMSYHDDIFDYCKRVYKNSDLDSRQSIIFQATAIFLDKYENESRQIAVSSELTVDTIRKINYENASYRTIEDLTINKYQHPGV